MVRANPKKITPNQHRKIRPTAKPKPRTKAAAPARHDQIIVLLRRPQGATMGSLTSATGWQPHSVRGLISAVLRKQFGLTVVSARNKNGDRVYRIVQRAASHDARSKRRQGQK